MTRNYTKQVLIIIAILAILFTVYFLNFTVAGSYILDINPSIKINVNNRGRVISLEGLNEDGNNVLKDFNLKGKDFDDVIKNLVDDLILNGYLESEIDSAIIISQNGEGNYQLEEIKEKIDNHLTQRSLNNKILTKPLEKEYDDDLLEDLQMSGARIEIIEEIRKVDDTFTPEELTNMKVGDLLYVLRKSNVRFDDLFDDWDDIGENYVEEYEKIHGPNYIYYDLSVDDYDDDLDDTGEDLKDDVKDDVKEEPETQPAPVTPPQPAPQPKPTPQPAPQPKPVPKPAPVYYDDDDDDWDDDNDDDDDDWDDDDDDDWDDDDWDDDDD